jgi:hypothetical protein
VLLARRGFKPCHVAEDMSEEARSLTFKDVPWRGDPAGRAWQPEASAAMPTRLASLTRIGETAAGEQRTAAEKTALANRPIMRKIETPSKLKRRRRQGMAMGLGQRKAAVDGMTRRREHAADADWRAR